MDKKQKMTNYARIGERVSGNWQVRSKGEKNQKEGVKYSFSENAEIGYKRKTQAIDNSALTITHDSKFPFWLIVRVKALSYTMCN
ncbi:MAG: hypothetical protein RBS07_00505 [Lentimicrobium sp.]|nr:hypothetical protein [Lentimicrobium sp.]